MVYDTARRTARGGNRRGAHRVIHFVTFSGAVHGCGFVTRVSPAPAYWPSTPFRHHLLDAAVTPRDRRHTATPASFVLKGQKSSLQPHPSVPPQRACSVIPTPTNCTRRAISSLITASRARSCSAIHSTRRQRTQLADHSAQALPPIEVFTGHVPETLGQATRLPRKQKL
jgi:hypothetical protein